MHQQPDASEEERLRSVALQTAGKVRLARQRAEEELARAKETLELRTAELERALLTGRTQLEIAEVLARAASIDEATHTILETLCHNLSCACAQLWRVDREAGVVRRSAGWCDGTMRPGDFEALARFDSLDIGVGLPGRIVQSQRAAWIEDVLVDPDFPRGPLVRTMGLRSSFGFPLIVAGEVAGVIELFSTERRGVDDAIVKMTATIGSHVGQFIERETAEANQRHVLKQLKLLQGVTETALAYRTLQELFDNLLTKICEAVGSDIAVVLMLDAKANDLYIAAAKGPNLDSLLHLRVRVGESLAGRVAAQRQVIIVRHATKDMSIRPALRAIGVETVLGVPLVARDQLIGVLEVGSFSDRAFTADDADFIQHVGHQVAIAIENASLYDQAREANRIRDRFLSIASHELKTPLNALLGWTEILRTIDNEEMRARGLEAIERNTRIQAELIEELLDASRIREGKLVLHLEPTDLASLVRSALKTVQPAAERRGVTLDSDLPATAPLIRADPARLRQVVWNLLTNSIKFTPVGRAIRTRARVDETSATITVEDEGSGISPDFLPRVFDELQQEEKATRAGGLGLGLYIAKTIVTLHGGTIEAHSEGIGRGATFVIRLPVAGPERGSP